MTGIGITPATLQMHPPRFGAGNKTLAVVDNFSRDHFSRGNATRLGENPSIWTSHGSTVSAHARLMYPDINIREYPIGLAVNPQSIKLALEEVLADLEKGERIDAVNLSISTLGHIETYAEKLGLSELTSENLADYRDEIRQSIKKQGRNEEASTEMSYIHVYQSIGLLEKITTKGVPVFICGGNLGPDSLNLLLLANGVTGVGALNPDGKKADWSGDNTLISQWELGEGFRAYPALVGGKIKGFRLVAPGQTPDQRKEPEIPLEDLDIHFYFLRKLEETMQELSQRKKKNPFAETLSDVFKRLPGVQGKQPEGFQPEPIWGTSLSSPLAAARYLKEQAKGGS